MRLLPHPPVSPVASFLYRSTATAPPLAAASFISLFSLRLARLFGAASLILPPVLLLHQAMGRSFTFAALIALLDLYRQREGGRESEKQVLVTGLSRPLSRSWASSQVTCTLYFKSPCAQSLSLAVGQRNPAPSGLLMRISALVPWALSQLQHYSVRERVREHILTGREHILTRSHGLLLNSCTTVVQGAKGQDVEPTRDSHEFGAGAASATRL